MKGSRARARARRYDARSRLIAMSTESGLTFIRSIEGSKEMSCRRSTQSSSGRRAGGASGIRTRVTLNSGTLNGGLRR